MGGQDRAFRLESGNHDHRSGNFGANFNVKIPITNTCGETSAPLVEQLSGKGVAVNMTAMFTLDQVEEITAVLDPATPAILSVFAGRVADSGRDPMPHMKRAVDIAKAKPKSEVLWASSRELYHKLAAVIRSQQEDSVLANALKIRIKEMRERHARFEDRVTKKRELVTTVMDRAGITKIAESEARRHHACSPG